MPLVPLLEHKNADFVLGKPENGGSEAQKRTKTPILCSKRLKMGVQEGKSAQKPRFCAREARKWGGLLAKAHKNSDFVLEYDAPYGRLLCQQDHRIGLRPVAGNEQLRHA